MNEQQKRPAHEVILSRLQQMAHKPEEYDTGEEGARRVILLCDVLTEMVIPDEHRRAVCDNLWALVSICDRGSAVTLTRTVSMIGEEGYKRERANRK